MNVLDLFSGIGGFSLGLERAGMRTVAFCEIDPFCRSVLAERWPAVPCYSDVRELSADRLGRDGIQADLICGGFPCQDISHAAGAKAKGLEGERSGLWFEMRRLVRELRPAWVLVENVPRLRTLGADTVLADLAEAGYTARPVVVGAIHAGADHIRKRVWILANSNSLPIRPEPGRGGGAHWESSSVASFPRAHSDSERESRPPFHAEVEGRAGVPGPSADTSCAQLEIGQGKRGNAAAELAAVERGASSLRAWEAGPFDGDPVVDGLPEDLDAAIKAYGNSVIPQITELLGRAIMSTASS